MKVLDLKTFDVWMQGYAATGEHGVAHLWGTTEARSFKEACHKVAMEKQLLAMSKAERGEIDLTEGYWEYDPHKLTWWGCRLFDNEVDARKSFG